MPEVIVSESQPSRGELINRSWYSRQGIGKWVVLGSASLHAKDGLPTGRREHTERLVVITSNVMITMLVGTLEGHVAGKGHARETFVATGSKSW